MLYILRYNIVYIVRYIIIPFFHISNSDQFSILIGGITKYLPISFTINFLLFDLLLVSLILILNDHSTKIELEFYKIH